MLGKKSSQKVRKYVFYTHTNIVAKKWGEKKRETIFPETRIVPENKLRKNIVSKKCDNSFFIFTRISWPKNRGINAQNNFSRNTRIVRAKNVGKKIVGKKCEKRFFIITRISWPKNGGKQTRETIFPETHE